MLKDLVKPRPDQLMALEDARSTIHNTLLCNLASEVVKISNALNRVLSDNIISPTDVPAHTNSALDGYAIAGADIPKDGLSELKVIGTSWAGRPFVGKCDQQQAVLIMTGAVMPHGTDTVIAREFSRKTENGIKIDSANRTGQNVRAAGEDLKRGAIVLPKGKRLMPAELGLLASLGTTQVKVYRKLKVAIFSTGDELRNPDETLANGGVYDSNRSILGGMLCRIGAEVIDQGIIRDKRQDVEVALMSAANSTDVIITTGGVSTGDADYVEEVLRECGELNFWRVSIKPGRPIAFGQIKDTVFFGLPGNPVAVMVTFYQLLNYALCTLMGESDPRTTPMLKVRCCSNLSKKAGRTEFYRGILSPNEKGELEVSKTNKQGSGVLHSMSDANCFIVLDDECEKIEPGNIVKVQPFFGLV